MTASGFDLVLGELADEHHQALDRHGYDEAHDDTRSDADFGWLLLRRVSELMAPETVMATTPQARRRALVEVAHIAASAIAAHDRRHAATAGVLEVEPMLHRFTAMTSEEPRLVSSVDQRWRYVTRPGDDAVERHRLGCVNWNERGTCRGSCVTDEEPPA